MSKEAAVSFDAVRAVKLDVLERLLWATDFGSGAAGVHPPTLPGARSAFRSPPFNSALSLPYVIPYVVQAALFPSGLCTSDTFDKNRICAICHNHDVSRLRKRQLSCS